MGTTDYVLNQNYRNGRTCAPPNESNQTTIEQRNGNLPEHIKSPVSALHRFAVLLIAVEVLMRLGVLSQKVPPCCHRRVLGRVFSRTELREAHHLLVVDSGIPANG